MNSEAPIGVFDSGIGGLTVLEAIRQVLPGENYIYLGDTARVPYGNRTSQTIIRYATSCARQLVDRGVKAIVIACNTASAHALEALRKTFDIPIFGVITPVSEMAAKLTQTQCIGVIGTRATISSGAYTTAIHTYAPDAKVYGLACPLFVPLVEEGWSNSQVAGMVVHEYLKNLLDNIHSESELTLDTLILGCTHYPVLKSRIAEALASLGQHVQLCDCGQATAQVLLQSLNQSQLRANRGLGSVNYLVTDDPAQLSAIGRSFMREPPKNVEHIDIV